MNAKLKLPEKRGVSSLEAPEFHAGTVLEADELNLIVGHTQQLSRLLFRSLLGCGVVCGLKVRARENCSKLYVSVACGLALDCCGEPIEVPSAQELVIDLCGAKIPEPLWVLLRRYEKGCAPRAAVCGDDDEETSVCTRVRDGYEIRITDKKPECACACTPKRAAPAKPAAIKAAAVRLDRDVMQEALQAGQGIEAMQPQEPVEAHAALTEAPLAAETRPRENLCRCADATLDCHQKHYAGECCCDSGECCDCEWLVLAEVTNAGSVNEPNWSADHGYRRFIRPVLMRDPLGIEREKQT